MRARRCRCAVHRLRVDLRRTGHRGERPGRGTNGDLGLTGLRQGTATFSGFRSNEFRTPPSTRSPGTSTSLQQQSGGHGQGGRVLVTSTDGGFTWSAPLRVNDDATTTDQWQPTLAVTPDGTNLGIFYYSREEDPRTPIQVLRPQRRHLRRHADVHAQLCDQRHAVAARVRPDSVVNSTYMATTTWRPRPRAFHVVWSDNRDDLSGGAPRKDPNVYYKKISLTISVTTTDPSSAASCRCRPRCSPSASPSRRTRPAWTRPISRSTGYRRRRWCTRPARRR